MGSALLTCVLSRRVVQSMAMHVLGPGEALIASGVGAGKRLLFDMVCVHHAIVVYTGELQERLKAQRMG